MKYFPFSILSVFVMLFTACSTDETASPALPTISISDLVIKEKDVDFTIDFNITLSAPSEEQVSFFIKTSDSTTRENFDYKGIDDLIVMSPGTTLFTLPITIIGDSFDEVDEIFTITLTQAGNATFADSVSVVTILNDDGPVLNTFRIPETGATSPTSYTGYNLVWQDEFDADQLNEADWTFEIGNGNNGWGNAELEYYRRENTSLVNGHLVIEAKRESFGGEDYTSSRIKTEGKRSFRYGRVDIRANLPFGQGIWPALWMLGENISTVGWPKCGEIDIVELIGGTDQDNTIHGTIHWDNDGSYANYGGSKKLSEGIFNDSFHVYSIIWDANQIVWLLDNVEYHNVSISPASLSEFDEEFFLLFNVAVGGNWPGSPRLDTPFPQWMIVDYVRVFQVQ